MTEPTKETSPYDDNELKHFNKLLKQEHQDTKEQIENIQASLDDLNNNQNDENSAAAHHQGDIASEEDEREKSLIMLEKEKDKISQIDDALGRIENGTYGICLETGEKIQKERLEAIPYTPYSIEASP